MKGTPTAPQDRDAAVSAAYLRLLGATQAAAAAAVGIGERTLRGWEDSQWWPAVEAEASDRWLAGAKAAARAALLGFIPSDPAMCRFALERLFPEFAPPTIRQNLKVEEDGPLEIRVVALPGRGS